MPTVACAVTRVSKSQISRLPERPDRGTTTPASPHPDPKPPNDMGSRAWSREVDR